VSRRLLIGLVMVLGVSGSAAAQELMDDTLTPLPALPAGMFSSGHPRLTSAPDAERLITATLVKEDWLGESSTINLGSRDLYVIIHVLRWADPTKNDAGTPTQTVQEQNWYVFCGDTGWTKTDFTTAKRLFGSKGFFLLVVHLNHARATGTYRLNYRVTITKKQPANVANLLAAAKLLGAGGLVPQSVDESQTEDLWAGRFFHVDDVPSDITIAPAVVAVADVTRRAVAPNTPDRDDPPGVFEPIPSGRGAASAPARESTGGAPGADPAQQALTALNQRVQQLETQLAATRKADAPSPQSLGDAQKFDNEGRYYWDVSIGVPVRKVSDFTRTDAGLDVKTVSTSTAFALLNIYFKPVDVKSPALNNIPHALFGVGLENKPLDRIFIGGAWGPVYANFFVGVAFKRLDENGKTTYPRELTFGLNVPILSVTKRLAEQTK